MDTIREIQNLRWGGGGNNVLLAGTSHGPCHRCLGRGRGISGEQGDGREEGVRLEEEAAGRPVRGPVEPLAVLEGGAQRKADGVKQAKKERARDSIVSSKKIRLASTTKFTSTYTLFYQIAQH